MMRLGLVASCAALLAAAGEPDAQPARRELRVSAAASRLAARDPAAAASFAGGVEWPPRNRSACPPFCGGGDVSDRWWHRPACARCPCACACEGGEGRERRAPARGCVCLPCAHGGPSDDDESFRRATRRAARAAADDDDPDAARRRAAREGAGALLADAAAERRAVRAALVALATPARVRAAFLGGRAYAHRAQPGSRSITLKVVNGTLWRNRFEARALQRAGSRITTARAAWLTTELFVSMLRRYGAHGTAHAGGGGAGGGGGGAGSPWLHAARQTLPVPRVPDFELSVWVYCEPPSRLHPGAVSWCCARRSRRRSGPRG